MCLFLFLNFTVIKTWRKLAVIYWLIKKYINIDKGLVKLNIHIHFHKKQGKMSINDLCKCRLWHFCDVMLYFCAFAATYNILEQSVEQPVHSTFQFSQICILCPHVLQSSFFQGRLARSVCLRECKSVLCVLGIEKQSLTSVCVGYGY